MKVLDIIKNLVRKDENRSREDHLSELVPIDLVFRGYGFWSGKRPFKFDPHPDYKKKKPYEKIIDSDDNDKRCKGLSSLNEDIDKNNEWISEKNRLSTKLLLKTVQHPTIAIDNKDLNLAINTPSILRKFPYWRFVMVKASPKYRKLDKTNSHAEIDDKQLYLLKEEIPVGEFVKRFNKTIFDCLLKERQEAEKLDIWDGEHTWWYPLREFANWFSKNGIDSSSVDSFINGNKEFFLPSVSILTQKQMSYIKLCKMTNQHISAYPITAGEEKMSVRKAVKIIYNSHPDEFPDWAEGSLNKCYHLGLDLTINSD